MIEEVEREITQQWEIFINSPKKLAAYLKVQNEMKQLTLSHKGKQENWQAVKEGL